MQDVTYEIPVKKIPRSRTPLLELGIKSPLALYYEKLDTIENALDFTLLHTKLSMAMSKNFFRTPLKCIDDWQLLVLSGLTFDPLSLERWVAASINPDQRKYEIKDNWDASPLHYLAWGGNIDNLKWILDKHLELVSKTDKYGRTLIHFWALSGNLGGLDLIRKHCPKELYKKDLLGATPIHYCTWSNNPKALPWIKKTNDKDLKIKDSNGRTPIHYFAWSDKTDTSEQMKILSKKDLKIKDASGKTTAHFASMTGNCEKLNAIHKNYPKMLHKMDKNGETPVQLAAKSGKPEVFNWIVGHCADIVTKKAKNGDLLSHYAALSGDPQVLNQALALSKNPNTLALCNTFSMDQNVKIIKTLKKAFKTNYTLTHIQFNDFDLSKTTKKLITDNLARNLSIKSNIVRFLAFIQGVKQLESPVSKLINDQHGSIVFILIALLSEEVSSLKMLRNILPQAGLPVETYNNLLSNRFFTQESVSTQTSVTSSHRISFGETI